MITFETRSGSAILTGLELTVYTRVASDLEIYLSLHLSAGIKSMCHHTFHGVVWGWGWRGRLLCSLKYCFNVLSCHCCQLTYFSLECITLELHCVCHRIREKFTFKAR